jgi:hypothetical protein
MSHKMLILKFKPWNKPLFMNVPYNKAADDFGKRNSRLVRITLLVAVLWLSAIVTSMAFILRYSNSPGHTGVTPIFWPVDSRIALDVHHPTLIMFAHPHCPCTRASIGELDQLMADCQGQFSAQVWFVKSVGTTEDWTDTDLWHIAAAIPGVTVHRDDNGVEARRFQAETSGQTLLYDRDGQLLFHGGITISRGHAGDNPGCNALEALLKHKTLNQSQTPIFGCPLFAAFTNQSQIGSVRCKQ